MSDLIARPVASRCDDHAVRALRTSLHPGPTPVREAAMTATTTASTVLVPDDHVVVLFGATGDLAKRKLIPGLFRLHRVGLAPHGFRVLFEAELLLRLNQF